MNANRDPAALVLLHVGPWSLALPRGQVRDLVSPEAMQDTGLPLLALDDLLRPAAASAPARRVGVVLQAAGGPFVLACDRFEHRIEGEVALHELPGAALDQGSPARGVLQHPAGAATLIDAYALALHYGVPLAAPESVA